MTETDLGTNLIEDVPMPPVKGVKAKKPDLPQKVRIVLDENDEIPPTGQFIGVNGRGYLLRPGEEVEVPPEVVNVLNDAVKSTPVVDPQTGQVLGHREKRRFPYTVVSKH